jgi:leucyl aminopeptidase
VAQGFRERADAKTVPLVALEKAKLAAWLKGQDAALRAWVAATDFKAEPGTWRMVAARDGALGRVLVGVDPSQAYANWAAVAAALPPGTYRIEGRLDSRHATAAGLAWALAGYEFAGYKSDAKPGPARALAWPERCDRAYVRHTAEATALVRDLINTPTEDLGPAELAAAARTLARKHKARCTVISGDQLLARNYPTIHAVGRASSRPPRLIDIVWGRANDPKVTLVGKGVCFDTGGLDLKQATGMLRMKKDMGGGAHALGLAHMIMAHRLPVRLRVLVPAVENSVSGNAIRPLDVVKTRKGITVEIGNTDAEGRLILCDALAEADREKPEVIVDYATLTGAARVALGPELPALFCNDDKWAEAALAAGTREDDPMWRMPLWKPYRERLKSPVADINNVSDGPQGGAITAALYLNEFVSPTTPWLHIDLMAWNDRDKPGKPQGGEAQAMRAVYALIAEQFGKGRGK